MRASSTLLVLLATAVLASGCSLTLGLGELDQGGSAGASTGGPGGGAGGTGGGQAGTGASAGGNGGVAGSGGTSPVTGGNGGTAGASGVGGAGGIGGSDGGSAGTAGSGGGIGGQAGSGGSGTGGSGGTAGSAGAGGSLPVTPIDIVTGQKNPGGICVDATYVYWVTSGPAAIFRAPKAGGPTETLVTAVDLTAPRDVASDGTTLYWSEPAANLLRSKTLAGGAPKDVAPGAGRVAYLELTSGKIFATDDRTDQPQDGTVSFNMLGMAGFNVLYGTEPLATGIGSDGAGNLAWATAGNIVLGKASGTNRQQLVASKGLGIDGVAMDASHVYWVEAGQRIRRAAIATGAVSNVYDPPGALGHGDVAVDATFVYWTEPDTGSVRKMVK